ncbi:hypothetical protein L249_1625 [Ophiocordyceps polyrhachis-furcata BCC 54312]|uniref:Uncharacterized protein n=1 Tax=Ophiocordyceps polyrhachis-furcata BCC 54312 TaxID=1330021 RepID=A0A367KZH2_9HYPO|nr:hypothetical protein L249_1625 [Ophiocordyceps polyrhachis-furcata BCC 54312]
MEATGRQDASEKESVPSGITKSNSNRSAESLESVKAIGNCALGSVRLLRPEPGDGSPPPLLPSTSGEPPRNPMVHALGGGDVVVILNLPTDYTIGYDSVAFTAPNFVGIRNIPHGPHFFWASQSVNASARCGFWIMSSADVHLVHVVEWHRYHEIFVQPTHADARIQAGDIESIYNQLPSFRYPSAPSTLPGMTQLSTAQASAVGWNQLTGHITATLLDRVTSDQEDGWNLHTCDQVKGSLKMPAEIHLDRSLSHLTSLFQSHELEFCFQQQTRTFSLDSFGSDRSRDAVDTTTYILDTLASFTEQDILGDLQFAYIVGVYLGNDACVQQWWFVVVRIFLRAHRLIDQRPEFVALVLDALTAQLCHSTYCLDGSLLDSNEAQRRELQVSLIVYRSRMKEVIDAWLSSDSPALAAAALAFEKLEAAVAHLGWDLDDNYLRRGNVMLEDGAEVELELDELEAEDERGEFAPEVVELDEQGRQVDLVSWSG